MPEAGSGWFQGAAAIIDAIHGVKCGIWFMAVWQFDFHLLPVASVDRNVRATPLRIPDEEFEAHSWWSEGESKIKTGIRSRNRFNLAAAQVMALATPEMGQ
jgi:hypothetical protein